MDKKKLLISFSGGRTSAYMVWWVFNVWEERDNYEIVVVFSNTGLEASETYVFVHQIETLWNIPVIWVEARHLDDNGKPFSKKGWSVKHQVVNYFTAATKPFKGIQLQNPPYWKSEWSWTPFEEMISVLGIPASHTAFCSDQLKKKAIISYLKSIGWKKNYKMLGIRYDEPDRLTPKNRVMYLGDYCVMSKWDIMAWWVKQEFDLKVRKGFGNCEMCIKKSIPSLVENYKCDNSSIDWWKYINDTYGHFDPRNIEAKKGYKPPFNFFRGGISPDEIIELSKLSKQELNKKIKPSKKSKCDESCEAF